MPTGIPIVDGVQAGIGLAESVASLINQGKEKQEARRLAANRPQIGVDPLVNQGLDFAENELGSNLTSGERAYNTLNNGQFSSSIGASLKSGASPNSIGAIYGNSEDGRLRLATMRDNLRLNQINNYVQASNAKQNANQTEFLVDKLGPYKDEVAANAAARQGSQLQLSQGLNTFGSAIGNAGQALQQNKDLRIPTYTNNPDYNSNGYANGVPTNNFNSSFYNPNVVLPENIPQYNR